MSVYKKNKKPEISHLVCVSKNDIIGNNQSIPWNLPEDMARFKYLSMGKNLVMGRKTFESLPKKLIGRDISIISKNFYSNEYRTFASPRACIDSLLIESSRDIVIAGGESIYKATFDIVSVIYMTTINHSFEGDTYYLPIDRILEEFEIDYQREFESIYKYSFLRFVRREAF